MTLELKYTMIFIKQRDQLLLLNRKKPPLMGLWTGVGGKIEHDESPEAGARREVFEETGLDLSDFSFRGIVQWKTDSEESGMYLFLSELPNESHYKTPIQAIEGILDWKEISWITDTNNMGIPVHVQRFLSSMLNGELLVHHCIFQQNALVEYWRESMKVDNSWNSISK